MASNFGIPTPPAIESSSSKYAYDNSDNDKPKIVTGISSVLDMKSSEPSTPISPSPKVTRISRFRYYFTDKETLNNSIFEIATEHNIKIPEDSSSYKLTAPTDQNLVPSLDSSSSVQSSSNVSSPSDTNTTDTTDTTEDASKSDNNSKNYVINKKKRKGIPRKAPDLSELEQEPGIVFSFPTVFQAGPQKQHRTIEDRNAFANPIPAYPYISNNLTSVSAALIHRPVLLPDIVRKMTDDRRSQMRSRPTTRAKNKRDHQELEYLKSSGLESIRDPTDNAAPLPNQNEESSTGSRRGRTTMRGKTSPTLAKAHGNDGNDSSFFYYHVDNKRRFSESSLSSMSTSELSEYDLNIDNFDDDEDDPDFAPPAKKRKAEHAMTIKTANVSPARVHRRDSNKTKVCASCRTRTTPCWRPAWSSELFLCNSCGLR
ncbi:9632_t:CDS:2 [Diversispora eburnea]|uniref:9632_t:CDS:1 n=1 Tax=Diversispora eburnea TaxID=1213867 RepID=A0A9N8ZK42_9GLOM|nr:9632_t:CDS:2 [Diversispora eburnea]